MHDIEINKSFRLLVLFGNGYKASRVITFLTCPKINEPLCISTFTDVFHRIWNVHDVCIADP